MRMSEKWVVVSVYASTFEDAGFAIDEVHGFFDSEEAADNWAYEEFSALTRMKWDVKRIRNANIQEWA